MPPRIHLRGIDKSFGGTHALRSIELSILPGEVHGLLGENGSGKSTLIKILNGFHAPDGGSLEIDGREIRLPLAPGEFQDLGLSFVHQDLALIPELSVLENLRLVDWSRSKSFSIDWRDEIRSARELLDGFGLGGIDPSALVSSLDATRRAQVAIVRAAHELGQHARGGGALILDEPTVFLPREGVERLFEIVREVAARGVSVIFVSHDIDEVLDLTDRVTILRDGAAIATHVTAEVTAEELIESILGRPLSAITEAASHVPVVSDLAIDVRDVAGGQLGGVSFRANAGEVLGLTGLAGSGYEQVPYALFGGIPEADGALEMGGTAIEIRDLDPAKAVSLGIALVPADRLRDGAYGALTVGDNMTGQVLDEYGSWSLKLNRMWVRADELLRQFRVVPENSAAVFSSLSGGNQQKVVLAKWLEAKPRFLLLHEPTQGVDVGAREQIYSLLADAVSDGLGVVCASSDYEQLAAICDRVLVLGKGSVVRELVGEMVTKEMIAQSVYDSVKVESLEGAGAA